MSKLHELHTVPRLVRSLKYVICSTFQGDGHAAIPQIHHRLCLVLRLWKPWQKRRLWERHEIFSFAYYPPTWGNFITLTKPTIPKFEWNLNIEAWFDSKKCARITILSRKIVFPTHKINSKHLIQIFCWR